MLGYRSFFSTVETDEEFDKVLSSQVHGWLRQKGFEDSGVEIGRNEIAPATFVDLVVDESVDHSRRQRFRLSEGTGWTTQITTESGTGSGAWVWLEIHPPEGSPWTATPGLIRRLVGTLEVRDGRAVLRDKPMTVHVDDVDELVDVVCDPDRRGPVFVAGSTGTLAWGQWSELVNDLLAETVGLAGAYLLDSAATSEFARIVGASHAVPPGSVRTFMPGADPADDLDARRHRILGPMRIAEAETRHLRRMLGRVARRQLLDQPLPDRISRVDRALQRQESELLVSQLAGSALQVEHVPVVVEAEVEADVPTSEPLDIASEAPDVIAAEASLFLALSDVAFDVLGRRSLDLSSIAEIAQLAKRGLVGHAAQESVRARLGTLQSTVESLEDDRALLQVELDDSRLEEAEQIATVIHLQDQVRYLQRALERSGDAEIAWAEVPLDERTVPPDSFANLLERAGELRHVDLPADTAPAIDLDEHDLLGNCAAKTWAALLALDNYVQARLDGKWNQGVHPYLKETPAGYRGYSSNRHSPNESSSVNNNSKYHDARVFVVPVEVDVTGFVYMPAHFKLGAKKTISPRLHYLDAFDINKRVLVGYVGRHLPSPQTN